MQNGRLPQTGAARLGSFKGKESIPVFQGTNWHKPALWGPRGECRVVSNRRESAQPGCRAPRRQERAPRVRLGLTGIKSRPSLKPSESLGEGLS